MNKINKEWIRKYTHPSICFAVFGEHFLAMIEALRWSSVAANGSARKRQAAEAKKRIVAGLPCLSTPEIILTRSETVALVCGVESIMELCGAHPLPYFKELYEIIIDTLKRSAQAKGIKHNPEKREQIMSAMMEGSPA